MRSKPVYCWYILRLLCILRDNSQASGRDKALAAAREAMNPRSQSVMGPPPSLSRENSGPSARSHSMVQQNSNNSYQGESHTWAQLNFNVICFR